MGIFSDISAAVKVQKIKRGGAEKLSIGQITNLIINLPDAQKHTSESQFQQIHTLYKRLRQCRTKLETDFEGYLETAVKIIALFDRIAPYEQYSGGDPIETAFLMSEVRRMYEDDPNFSETVLEQILGEQQQPKKVRKKFFAILMCAVPWGLCAVLGYRMMQIERTSQAQIQAQQERITQLETSVGDKDTAITSYRTRIAGYQQELRFWENNAVIVTQSGEKYHTYWCQYIEGKDFTIYNVESAVRRGYEPCSVCNPPRG